MALPATPLSTLAPPQAAALTAGFERELSVALEGARLAGALQIERYERLERIIHKSTHDVVTEVDTLSEQLIIETIRGAFPADRFLAEESGHSGQDRAGIPEPSDTPKDEALPVGPGRQPTGPGRQPAGPPARIWIIDPLDGTVNYANGIPIFCVSIALVVDGKPTVGVVLDPARDDLYCAVAGGGAFLNDIPIRSPLKEKLSDLVVHLALPPHGFARRENRVRKRIRVSRVTGSAALALAWVGNGRFDAFVQPRGLSLWDVAAAGLIAAEGGSLVTDGEGHDWFDLARSSRGVGILAAPPDHHATFLELLR
ncbi:MAG: inositol monophosphatase [Chloroflexi bacterium]|nr:inositol monophosphatase [Chloroflexota bacterium]